MARTDTLKLLKNTPPTLHYCTQAKCGVILLPAPKAKKVGRPPTRCSQHRS